MINLRYHIVSLTAVFLAIGIGLTLGSTFLDRATVENLNGQLENLEARLGDRDQQIDELQAARDDAAEIQTALDEQGASLVAGRMESTPVLIVAAAGVDEADVDRTVETLQVAGAEVQGLWWLTERLLLRTEADVDDLAAALDESSQDPARLRRLLVDALGSELRARQLEGAVDEPTEDEQAPVAEGEEPSAPDDTAPGAGDEDDGPPPDTEATPGREGAGDPVPAGDPDDPAMEVARSLIDAGFLRFEPVTDGVDEPVLVPGVRIVVVGGSSVLPDDVLVAPLVGRLARGTSTPTLTLVSSAKSEPGEVAEIVSIVRGDERLRSVVSTVDTLDHFQGWMALALAVEDLGEGVVGHYGLGEGASSLLPPLRAP